MEASDVRRLKDLELENSRLKRLLADNDPRQGDFKGGNRKKRLGPDERRELITLILMRFRISLRRALALINLTPSMYCYRRKRDDQPALELMRAYADENPAHGQDMMAKVFHKSHGWNHKKTERLYAKLKLAKLRKKRLQRLVQVKEPLVQPLAPNECWGMDFMSDSLTDGNKVRVLNVIDDYNR